MPQAYKRSFGWMIRYVDAQGLNRVRRTRATSMDEALKEAREWQRREDVWRQALQTELVE
jgi:hypothetical protein